jgi:hypothetical protein
VHDAVLQRLQAALVAQVPHLQNQQKVQQQTPYTTLHHSLQ